MTGVSEATLRGCALTPGIGALATVLDSTSSMSNLLGPVHTLRMPGLLREGEPFDFEISGPPGHRVALAFSFAPSVFDFWFSNDLLSVGPIIELAPLGRIPSSGLVRLASASDPLAPSALSATFFVQLLAIDQPGQNAYVGSARSVVLLDQQF